MNTTCIKNIKLLSSQCYPQCPSSGRHTIPHPQRSLLWVSLCRSHCTVCQNPAQWHLAGRRRWLFWVCVVCRGLSVVSTYNNTLVTYTVVWCYFCLYLLTSGDTLGNPSSFDPVSISGFFFFGVYNTLWVNSIRLKLFSLALSIDY